MSAQEKFIIVRNKTETYQNYQVFAEKPIVSGVDNSRIWSTVHKLQKDRPGTYATDGGSVTTFSLGRNLLAAAGKLSGPMEEGAAPRILNSSKPVFLGSSKAPGSTFKTKVQKEELMLPRLQQEAPDADERCFEVRTDTDFDIEQSKQRNYFIGVSGCRESTYSPNDLLAAFQPEPGRKYQIQPVNTYYLSPDADDGDRYGQLLDVSKVKTKLALNFDVLPSVIVVDHNVDNTLSVVNLETPSPMDTTMPATMPLPSSKGTTLIMHGMNGSAYRDENSMGFNFQFKGEMKFE